MTHSSNVYNTVHRIGCIVSRIKFLFLKRTAKKIEVLSILNYSNLLRSDYGDSNFSYTKLHFAAGDHVGYSQCYFRDFTSLARTVAKQSIMNTNFIDAKCDRNVSHHKLEK